MRHTLRTFESLEPRHALTAITATLTGGLLSIDAHDINNTVTLSRTAAKIKLAETSQVFNLSQVKSIDINLQGSTDIITLTNALRTKLGTSHIPLTASSGGGDDQLVKPGGNRIYFGDGAPNLAISKSGRATLDGNKLDWFSTHIPDNDVGSLLRQESADNVLTRGDMLNVFNLVEQQSTVGSENYTTLQTIVAHTSLFKNFQYVQNLANLVINPSVANALYQGNALGNLSAASTSGQLTLLVDKWFLGLDHPDATADHPDVTWRDVEGTLFNGPPDMYQIHQGADDDCYFLAAMESIAIHNPQVIENMFTDNGDGTYTVRFYHGKQAVYLTIDSQLPILPDGNFAYDDHNLSYNDPNNILWSAFAEKAYAQLAELGWSRPHDPVNSYHAINYGVAYEVMPEITGQKASDYSMASISGSHVAQLFSSDRPIVFGSKHPSTDPNIVPEHAYALVGYNAQTKEFELFNPWGFHAGNQYPALIWLTWQEIVDHFSDIQVGSRV